jgi:hypothetical protein
MGAISGLLGTGGGANGTGFAAPTEGGATINPFNNQAPNQISDSYIQNQDAIWQQQQLVNALNAQNGIQNQSNVYGQLQNIAAGQGPNPAQAQLAQATGANTANQAALMAGQRGSAQNVGLIARQAAQQGATNQQQSAGQAATLQAQQSLNALGQAGTLAGNQVSNQIGTTATLNQAQQNEQQQLLNALSSYNATNAGLQANINTTNAGLAGTAMQGQQAIVGGALQGIGSGLGMLAGAEGGEVPNYDDGGPVSGLNTAQNAPQSSFGKFLKNWSSGNNPDAGSSAFSDMGSSTSGGQALNQGASSAMSGATKGIMGLFKSSPASPTTVAGGPLDVGGPAAVATMAAAKGGQVPALVSPGEKYLPPKEVKKVEKGANPMAVGKTIPGKPKVPGSVNSYTNDTVPAKLEEGGIVLPRSVTQSKDPAKAAHEFVAAIMSKHGKSLPKKSK